MPTTPDPAHLLEVAERAARAAGRELMDRLDSRTVRHKGPGDLVTDADDAAQAAVARILTEVFPDHDLYGEEGLREQRGGEYQWTIDPLDGTGNYVHGFPYFGVSIACEKTGPVEEGGGSVAAVVFDPNRDELFAAARGHGATLNGTKIHTSGQSDLPHAMLMASMPRACSPSDPAVVRFAHLLCDAETVQRSGSAALNLAYTACGRIDGFWSTSLMRWDMAAGVLLVTEAGGTVGRTIGGRFDLGQPDVLACATRELCEAVVAKFEELERERL